MFPYRMWLWISDLEDSTRFGDHALVVVFVNVRPIFKLFESIHYLEITPIEIMFIQAEFFINPGHDYK